MWHTPCRVVWYARLYGVALFCAPQPLFVLPQWVPVRVSPTLIHAPQPSFMLCTQSCSCMHNLPPTAAIPALCVPSGHCCSHLTYTCLAAPATNAAAIAAVKALQFLVSLPLLLQSLCIPSFVHTLIHPFRVIHAWGCWGCLHSFKGGSVLSDTHSLCRCSLPIPSGIHHL